METYLNLLQPLSVIFLCQSSISLAFCDTVEGVQVLVEPYEPSRENNGDVLNIELGGAREVDS